MQNQEVKNLTIFREVHGEQEDKVEVLTYVTIIYEEIVLRKVHSVTGNSTGVSDLEISGNCVVSAQVLVRDYNQVVCCSEILSIDYESVTVVQRQLVDYYVLQQLETVHSLVERVH